MPFLGSALGLTAMCSRGWGNLVGFDSNDFPVGREFDCQFLKKVKSPPHALPPPPPPPPAGITLIGALLVLIYSKLYSKSLTILIVLLFTWFTTIGKKAQTILTQHLFYIYVLVILKHFSAWFLHKLVVNYTTAHIKCPCTLPKFSCTHTNL